MVSGACIEENLLCIIPPFGSSALVHWHETNIKLLFSREGNKWTFHIWEKKKFPNTFPFFFL